MDELAAHRRIDAGSAACNGAHPATDGRLSAFLDALSQGTRGLRVLVVASVDLAHVGPQFGDAYLMDEDGYFFYQARTDDMIISSGYNIAGPEVEGVLLAHPAVAECGVVGAPDPDRGMVVKAFVVLKPGHAGTGETVKALQEHVKSVIAPYKYPRVIEFVDTLPRTETGKLQRFKLRGQEK